MKAVLIYSVFILSGTLVILGSYSLSDYVYNQGLKAGIGACQRAVIPALEACIQNTTECLKGYSECSDLLDKCQEESLKENISAY